MGALPVCVSVSVHSVLGHRCSVSFSMLTHPGASEPNKSCQHPGGFAQPMGPPLGPPMTAISQILGEGHRGPEVFLFMCLAAQLNF